MSLKTNIIVITIILLVAALCSLEDKGREALQNATPDRVEVLENLE
jgi:hypothetical protein